MENREDEVIEKMQNLIKSSCVFETQPEKRYCNFHKIFFKFFFNAIDVNIDYEKQVISISNSKPLTTNPVRLFDMTEAVADKICYTDLEETLSGCLGEFHLHNNFYKKMLSEYAAPSNCDKDCLSA